MILQGCLLFFQAEDGIRDLVRSRGLGDVYKRQEGAGFEILDQEIGRGALPRMEIVDDLGDVVQHHLFRTKRNFMGMIFFHNYLPSLIISVSYTHLTLPTSDLV